MFTIFLSILLSTSALGASTQFASVPWSNLKNDKSLVRFHSTLLNETLLTFLTECNGKNMLDGKINKPCTRYFDAVLQLNSTRFEVPFPRILTLVNESSGDKEFCQKNHTYPAPKNFLNSSTDFNEPITCAYMCLEENSADMLVPRPICVFLDWMGKALDNVSGNASSELVSVPPPPVIPKNNTSHATNEVVSKESTKPKAADAAANPEPTSKTAITPKNVPAPTATKNVEKKVSAERKETAAVEAAPPATATASDEGAVKAEKPPAATNKEDQEDSPQPQKEETLLQNYQNNHDSVPINQQANPDQDLENEIDMNSEPDNDGEDGPEENEDELKSSPEIVDKSDLLNTQKLADPFQEESGSNFFTYFLIGMFLCILLYVVYHNKSKILGLLLEGRRSDKGRSGRRKHTAAYRKLDSNLEEAITSSASGRTTQIIY